MKNLNNTQDLQEVNAQLLEALQDALNFIKTGKYSEYTDSQAKTYVVRYTQAAIDKANELKTI